jgi:HSP20 family protein
MELLRREMGNLLGEPRGFEGNLNDGWQRWPWSALQDTGEALVIRAEVPGLSENDLEITITGDTVSISGERNVDAPEGYTTHHKERSSFKFSRNFQLPTKVNSEQAEASVKNGILELTIPKASEAKPKKISVKAH